MSVLEMLGQVVVYGGGAAAIAFFVFQFLGKSWIENKFAQSLDSHRHAQALEIQRLRVEIDSMLSGAIKIQEKEFEILPEAWQKLDEAYGRVLAFVSPMQEYVDLDRKTSTQLEEFLAVSKLTDSEKEDVRQSDKKTSTYTDIFYWHRLSEVRRAVGGLHSYVARNAIFFPPELKVQFTEASNALWSALTDHEIGFEEKDRKLRRESWKAVEVKMKPLHGLIEAGVYSRLQGHGK